MELLNTTKMEAEYTMSVQPDGRQLLVVVVKGTFTIPLKGENPCLVEEQVPLIKTDVFVGEPGFSAPLYDIDFVPRKPKCDVLLNGSAYAPNGKPTESVDVSLKVGSMTKSLRVLGNRAWGKGLISVNASNPKPFTVMSISYDNAFGGVDTSHDQESKYKTYLANPVGVGFHDNLKAKAINGKPLPNTEEIGEPVTKPDGTYSPMAFGPLGRSWQQRIKYGGTYDQNWLDDVFPFLPADFKEEYYQASPEDQWIDYPTGGEDVELYNLTPLGKTTFRLPEVNVPFEFFYKNGDRKMLKGIIDTLFLEPTFERFTLCWRACLPLCRSIHEIARVVAGRVLPEGYEEPETGRRVTGKPHISLAELVAAKQAREK